MIGGSSEPLSFGNSKNGQRVGIFRVNIQEAQLIIEGASAI
jgi:hypothetical protein